MRRHDARDLDNTRQMRPVIRAVLLGIGAAVVLGGCASMSEKDCLTANWSDQAYRDGRQGYPLSRIEDHREACSKVGVVPDVALYRRGHGQGVLEYCTPPNAVAEGRSGRSYRNACPAALEGEFLAYYELGRRAFHAQQRVDDLYRESQRVQRTLDKEKNESKRRRLRNELRDLDRDLRNARDTLHYEEQRLPY